MIPSSRLAVALAAVALSSTLAVVARAQDETGLHVPEPWDDTPPPEPKGWPRMFEENVLHLTVHQPQVERLVSSSEETSPRGQRS